MITIDGTTGEGGGQVLRTSLALSLVTGAPFTIERIRGGRAKPGLMRQHLACVRAAAWVGAAVVEGDELGSSALVFRPTASRGGDTTIRIGSAGSCNLVVQTVLPALLYADQPSDVRIEGGTHNPLAPSFEYLDQAFLPLLRQMGADVTLELVRPGFAPAGGGEVRLRARPSRLSPLFLPDAAELADVRVDAIVCSVPTNVGFRETERIRRRLGVPIEGTRTRAVSADGPGNCVWVTARTSALTECFVGYGDRGKRAEAVADEVADGYEEWRRYGPVGPHLADQLMLPLALAGGGAFTTGPLTLHSETNQWTIERFLPVRFANEAAAGGRVKVTVGPAILE